MIELMKEILPISSYSPCLVNFPFAFLSDKKKHEEKTQRRKVYVLCGKHIPREHSPKPPLPPMPATKCTLALRIAGY